MDFQDHDLSWDRCNKKQWVKTIEHLAHYEKCTLADLGSLKCHSVPRGGWKKRLRDQMKEDGLTQVTEVYSLRLGGPARAICHQEGFVFHLRYFDPGHLAINSKFRDRGER